MAMARRRPQALAVVGILAIAKVAFLVPDRIRVPRDVARRGSPQLEKSQELLHQLADDMDELVKMLPEEGEDDDQILRREQAQAQQEAPPAAAASQALATGSMEVGQVVSGLDVGALQPVGDNQYIATVEQIQAIVNDKVQKYTAVIKSFERYINELEEELEKTEAELEKKDQTLQEEARLRQEAQAEVLKLADEREEMERSLLMAQEVQSKSTAIMGGLNSQAERFAGELTEEEASDLEESLMMAQAKNARATRDADDRFGELQETQPTCAPSWLSLPLWGENRVLSIFELEASAGNMGNATCCSKDESSNTDLPEQKEAPTTAPETPVVEEAVAPQPREGEFIIVLDKTNGQRLGMDVDHEDLRVWSRQSGVAVALKRLCYDQDGRTLAVDAITGGLIEQWNMEHPEKALRPKDRIVEVNVQEAEGFDYLREEGGWSSLSKTAGPQRREDVLGHFLDGFRKTRSESNALVFSVHWSLAV
eukprot:s2814_g8.t1